MAQAGGVQARRDAKKMGQASAKEWSRTSPHGSQIALAGCGFRYGMTLEDLSASGLRVPQSRDVDFSWGFFKQIKGHVHHALYRQSTRETSAGVGDGDLEGAEAYGLRIGALSALIGVSEGINAERGRYEEARSQEQVTSVFRAVAPILERVVKDLLHAHGSTKHHSSIGPMISELRSRSIGDRALWSQLDAVRTCGRDISLHGDDVPLPVLRILTVTCFELFPVLAELFPAGSA